LSPRQLLARTAGFTAAAVMLVALVVVAESVDPDWTAMATFRGGLKPPGFRLVASDDLDGFFARVEDLRARVDAAGESIVDSRTVDRKP
jgi:hypothetical protein